MQPIPTENQNLQPSFLPSATHATFAYGYGCVVGRLANVCEWTILAQRCMWTFFLSVRNELLGYYSGIWLVGIAVDSGSLLSRLVEQQNATVCMNTE